MVSRSEPMPVSLNASSMNTVPAASYCDVEAMLLRKFSKFMTSLNDVAV